MYLKSLEIQGFKSFPDKTVLKFNKGITAVVGPNGSGKSNIGDAMRWVMGEQSTKALRDDKMSGVIFHGTQSRPKSQFAQVTINIANDDRALDYETDVVSVSRKLYKNGDSEYLINGQIVRLKDVLELFMDTGLGRDGYSIIGQGRIADIVNGKSNDRREIFEEAAGISKFRSKKEDAEKKLAASEENISRLNDILAELESRIGPLKNQCEKAKKFRVLDDEKRKLEVSVWNYKLDEYIEKLGGYKDELEAKEEQYEALSDELSDSEKLIEESFMKSAEKSAEVDELKAKIHQVELDNSNANADIAVFENDILHLENNIIQLRDQIELNRSNKYFNETKLNERNKELEDLYAKKEVADKASAEKRKEFEKLLNKAQQSDSSVDEVNSAVSKVYLRKTELTVTLENAKNNLSDLQVQLEQSVNDKKELEENSSKTNKELDVLKDKKVKLEEKREELNNKLGGLNKLFENKNQKYTEANDEYIKADKQIFETQSKLKILNDLENSMEGFAYSVKHIMNAGKQGRINGICGSVAQLISVKGEYTVAVETALGGSLQNIIVNDNDTAKRCIRLLKENKAGRATFLPITSVKGTRTENKALENENGFVAMGSDLVKTDNKYKGIVDSLLGRICIAEDIDLANLIAVKYGYKFKIVTLDGQVINAGGSFTGGSSSRSTGILTRKNEIEELTSKIEKLENRHVELKAKRERLNQEIEKFSADIDGVKEQLGIVNDDMIRLESDCRRVSEFNEQYNNQLDACENVVKTYGEKLIATQKCIDDAGKEITEADAKIIELEAQLTLSKNEQNFVRESREKLSNELADLDIHSAELTKDIEACKGSIAQLAAVIESNSDDSGKISLSIIENENAINQKKKDIADINTKISQSGDLVGSIRQQIENAQREHLEYDNKANKLRSLTKNKTDEKETLSAQITRLEDHMSSVQGSFDKLVGQLFDDYELTRSEAAEIAEELEDIDEANKKLMELRNKIKALGNVNLSSIEEYAEVSERYEFMTNQLDDVKKSKLELEQMICELTENMKNLFIQTFDIINKNFGGIFTELFGGGSAELVLTDPEDVLNCGIDIHAQPPGKVITNLMSLSGGEQALVAVSIYFAILKNSPSPFCLLDEIEAALDDANVSKYAQFLHRLTDKTQFITITHRRGTMEEADMLYGVTMQEKGISRLLAMSPDETRQMKLE